jgi:hypothetical protein
MDINNKFEDSFTYISQDDINIESDLKSQCENFGIIDPGGVKFTFGKYNDYTIREVYDIDKGYLYWCIKTPGVIRKHRRLISAIHGYIKKKKEDIKILNNHDSDQSISSEFQEIKLVKVPLQLVIMSTC